MKKSLFIGTALVLVFLAGLGYFYFSSQKANVNEVTPVAGCTKCSGGTACNACSSAPNEGYRCNCSGSLGGNYATCTGSLDSSCSGAATDTGACTPRYYVNLETQTCNTTTRNYNSAEIDCSGGTGKTCVVNLQEWEPGKTAGSCFKTLDQCLASTTICSPRYYYNTKTKACTATNRSYSSKNIDCDGQTNSTCEENLQKFEPGNTTGICYLTKNECSSASTNASPSPSPTPSPSSIASPASNSTTSPTPTPTPSPRVSMPDTSEGTPVTGVFEVTTGTIGLGLIFLIIGGLGLLLI